MLFPSSSLACYILPLFYTFCRLHCVARQLLLSAVVVDVHVVAHRSFFVNRCALFSCGIESRSGSPRHFWHRLSHSDFFQLNGLKFRKESATMLIPRCLLLCSSDLLRPLDVAWCGAAVDRMTLNYDAVAIMFSARGDNSSGSSKNNGKPLDSFVAVAAFITAAAVITLVQ